MLSQAECESVVRSLVHEWRAETDQYAQAPQDLSFGQFLFWPQDSYPAYTNFRTGSPGMLARYLLELWFDKELGLTGIR
jgi:hypothetical protein